MLETAYGRRVAIVGLAVVLALPLSATAESRPRGGTDFDRMIAELERVLGPGAVEVRRGPVEARERETRRAPGAGPRFSDAEEAIVGEMNAHRARYGLEPLRLERRLSAAAADRADDMFARGYFDHVGPDGRSPFLTVSENGYRFRTVGENLAVGYRSAEAVVDGWMRSPGHRANILSRDFRDVGLALHEGAPVRGYGGPTVVALYAAER